MSWRRNAAIAGFAVVAIAIVAGFWLRYGVIGDASTFVERVEARVRRPDVVAEHADLEPIVDALFGLEDPVAATLLLVDYAELEHERESDRITALEPYMTPLERAALPIARPALTAALQARDERARGETRVRYDRGLRALSADDRTMFTAIAREHGATVTPAIAVALLAEIRERNGVAMLDAIESYLLRIASEVGAYPTRLPELEYPPDLAEADFEYEAVGEGARLAYLGADRVRGGDDDVERTLGPPSEPIGDAD